MSRGSRAALLGGLALAGLACGGCIFLRIAAGFLLGRLPERLSAPEAARGGRTVVLCAIDDLRRESLKPYGYRLDPAPEISALAARGAAAEGYRAASAATSPSLASLLTGLSPAEHGLLSARELGAHRLAPAVETLAEALQAAGWRTVGAVSLRQLERRLTGLDQGFDAWIEGGPASGRPLPAALVVEAALGALEALGGGEDLFLFLHLGDLRAEGGGAAWLEPHFAPLRGAEPAVDAALARAALDPAGALEELERLLARRRGDPALSALRAARYDARLEQVDRALGQLLRGLRARGGEPLVIVAGTRGHLLAAEPADGAAADPAALLPTALVAAGPGVGPEWRGSAGPDGLARLLRGALRLPEPPRAPAPAPPPGWELAFRLPPGVESSVRLGSPGGEITAVRGGARDVRRSPAGTSAELVVGGEVTLAVECARRTAPLSLVASGLGARSAARAAEDGDGAEPRWLHVPVFPPAAGAERPPARVSVERDGAWAVVRALAGPDEELELALWAYPPEAFGAPLELALDAGRADEMLLHGLDAALVRGRGPVSAHLRLRAGQRLAVAANLGGRAVAASEMVSDEGGPPGDLALYLPPCDAAALHLRLAGAPDVQAKRLYPGPPMEASYDLDAGDVRFLQRLGPLE